MRAELRLLICSQCVLATIILRVEYPPDYPDEPPRLDIIPPPNAPKYEHFDIQEDKSNLLQSLDPTIEEEIKLTGKQLWERGLVGKIEEDDGEDGLEGMLEKTQIEA
jgi:hypothetical protein